MTVLYYFSMTYPSHLLAGLIIGKATGDYPTAIAGSMLIDLDHMVSYVRHGIWYKPRALFKVLTDENDPWGDQRNFLHNVVVWAVCSALLMFASFKFGTVFSIAWFFHLVFDAFDNADYYPFYPSKKFVIKGFVKYYSKQEIIFDLCLLAVFLIM